MNNIFKEDIDLIISSSGIDWNKFRNSNVLITGAGGHIGTYLVNVLNTLNVKKNFNIGLTLVVRNKKKLYKNKYIPKNKKISVIEDYSLNFLKKYNKQDFLIHLASPSNSLNFVGHGEDVLFANIIMTKKIIDFIIKKKIKSFLFASSVEVYGQTKELSLSEDSYGYIDILDPRSIYSESKRLGENLCVNLGKKHNLPIKIARIFHTSGPFFKKNEKKVIPEFLFSSFNAKKINIFSNGKAERSFTYITDVVIGIFIVLLKGKPLNAYNIGNPLNIININGLAKKIKNIVNTIYKLNISVLKKKKRIFDSRNKNFIPNINKIRNIGFRPKINLNDTLKRTIIFYKNNI